jgi:hypothetical protein
MAITITPQVFFDLFVLCLSWQWDERRLTHMWTTVDKVVRILAGLGILTDKQRKLLYRDRRTQSLFRKSCGYIPSNLQEYQDGEKRNLVLRSVKLLVVSHDSAGDFSRERLLRDYRIFMSQHGKMYAESLEAKYAQVITCESYRAECARQEAELADPKARAAVSKRYRQRVEDETSAGAS